MGKHTMPPKAFAKAAKALKKTDPTGQLLMQRIDLNALRAAQKARGQVKLKVVSAAAWKRFQAAQRRKKDAYKNGTVPTELVLEQVCNEDWRFALWVNFEVPKKMFPSVLDPVFNHALGREWSDGSGTLLSPTVTLPKRKRGERRSVVFSKKKMKLYPRVRDLDYVYASKSAAHTGAKAIVGVLRSLNLKGSVSVEDKAWDPPRETFKSEVKDGHIVAEMQSR